MEKKEEYNGTLHELFIDLNETHHSVRRGSLYDILTKFGTPKLCFNEIYSEVRISEKLSDVFPNQNGLKQEDASPNIITVIKSSRMRWTKHVARLVEMRNAYKILVEKYEESMWKNLLYIGG
jgi:hypothetical protein